MFRLRGHITGIPFEDSPQERAYKTALLRKENKEKGFCSKISENEIIRDLRDAKHSLLHCLISADTDKSKTADDKLLAAKKIIAGFEPKESKKLLTEEAKKAMITYGSFSENPTKDKVQAAPAACFSKSISC